MRNQDSKKPLCRRTFLTSSAAATATVVSPASVFGTAANSTIELGLIGCGGRGTWIADLFLKAGKFKFVACADYFQDRIEAVARRHKIGTARCFKGLSGYKKLLDQKLDAVVIETPPAFHPEQAAAAVEAGRHVFVAKPIAVDVPGCQTIAQAGQKATQEKLVFLVDFQTRADPVYREAVGRVHRGDLGKIICAEAHYPWAGGGSGLASPTPELRLRYWFEWNDLCGDVIVEQDIHALDVATWILDSAPIKARGTKGRKVRLYGDFSDHFAVTYWFPGNVVLTFTSVKAVPGVRDEIRCKVFGSAGVIDTDYFGEVSIRGQKPFEGGQLKNLYNTGTVNNIAEFYCGINGGDYANGTVAPSVRSNLTCILGRTAAGLGQEVTWEEMIKANVRLEPNLRGLTS